MIKAVKSGIFVLHLSVKIETDFIAFHFKPFRKVLVLRTRKPAAEKLFPEGLPEQKEQTAQKQDPEKDCQYSTSPSSFSASASHPVKISPYPVICCPADGLMYN